MMRRRHFPITELYIVVGILIILLFVAMSSFIANGVSWWLAILYAFGFLLGFFIAIVVLGLTISKLFKKKK